MVSSVWHLHTWINSHLIYSLFSPWPGWTLLKMGQRSLLYTCFMWIILTEYDVVAKTLKKKPSSLPGKTDKVAGCNQHNDQVIHLTGSSCSWIWFPHFSFHSQDSFKNHHVYFASRNKMKDFVLMRLNNADEFYTEPHLPRVKEKPQQMLNCNKYYLKLCKVSKL